MIDENQNFKEEPVDERYRSLHNDVEMKRDQLHQLSTEIVKNDISNYPIFVAHQLPVDLGKPVFTQEKHLTNWNISVSILEDLVNKEVVAMDKVDDFRKVYKDPDQYFCFLVIVEDDPQFIFIKRSKHNSPLIPND